MYRFKKLLSLACVGCFALSSLAMSAGAVDVATDAQPSNAATSLSADAGKTVKVRVLNCDASGNTVESYIDVAIPDGATEKTQQQVISMAAAQEVGIPATRAPAPNGDTLGTATRTISPNNGGGGTSLVSCANGPKQYSMLAVYMKGIPTSIKGINIRIWSSSIGMSNCYQMNNPIQSGSTCTVWFIPNNRYGDTTFYFGPGDSLTAYGSTTGGSGSITTSLIGIM